MSDDSDNDDRTQQILSQVVAKVNQPKVTTDNACDFKASEKDFTDSIKDICYEALTLPMIQTKKTQFKGELKQNKTIENYLDYQLNIQLLKNCNQHVKFGVVYSYLYWKNFMSL